ncbi:hypothetical protein SAMN05421788_11133 [Filimonas lacunae]|uniref:Uncharacterized protein n=1 Tax=Filimonas lacunae TaxID=477680 RepID=A0A1N7RAF7_9BACT|nr:keratin [Filimonas lacunae]SIT32126.1 hypothetical protein SAMN05421788_11133 [Filimonas lacunae]
MASLGKKILSAFIEVTDSDQQQAAPETQSHTALQAPVSKTETHTDAATGNKFRDHFNKLFADANLPGPDYFEFSKMTEAMQAIADEKARYCAAFAGLQVQGMDKHKLLSSAQQYVQMLEADAAAFHSTIDQTVVEKVQSRKKEIDATQQRIQQLSQEIIQLQKLTETLNNEIAENEQKLENSTAGYAAALAHSKNKLLQDIEKIKQHIL